MNTSQKGKSHESRYEIGHSSGRTGQLGFFRGQVVDFSRFEGKPIAMFFSAGKDAIVAADILRKNHQGPIRYIYLYFVDGLEYVERTLRTYEKKWSISIDRRPCQAALCLASEMDNKRKRKFTYGDCERLYRKETGIEWICTGMKRNDSLARRGMLQSCIDGIDENGKRIHPLIDWNDKKVFAYCKLNRLPLPYTYSLPDLNFSRSLWIPNAEQLIWMKSNMPNDYGKIIGTFPKCGDAVFKKIGEI